MPNRPIPTTAALLSLAGAALGVFLGNGAIAEINPVHFVKDEPRSRFYADLAPQGYRDWASVHKAEFGAAQGGVDLGAGCVGCRTYPEEYAPVHRASLGKPETGWAEVVEAELAVEPDVRVHRFRPASAAIEPYTSFPVSAEEAAGLATVDPAAAGEVAAAE